MIRNRKELIKSFLEFFKDKNHAIIPSGSLIPENDPTVLFTTAGMHPLVPYLLGQKHPLGRRLVSVQKCLRTQDIDEVGTPTKDTFFEMLGNWSLGDYFKKESLGYSFEFLTDKRWLALELNKLAVTCFAGDKNSSVGKDEKSAEIWFSLGIPKHRIAFLGTEDNFWGPAGKTGPCGPCSEIFYWIGEGKAPRNFDPSDKRWLEVWNNVFMQYDKDEKGHFKEMKQKNVDTGMGVERVTLVVEGKQDIFETEMFYPVIKRLEELSGRPYKGNEKAMRIVADHLRAATFILGDGKKILPSNIEQGYVLRRLIRKAVRYGHLLGLKRNFTKEIAGSYSNIFGEDYPEIRKNKGFICSEMDNEEIRFKETLEKGMSFFGKIAENQKIISGKDAFLLFQSYGFPLEMTEELGKEKGIHVDKEGFQKEFEKHQELSRAASKGKFASGLADTSKVTTRLHTATHLLHAALRKILGEHVRQKGSNITPERLRFDFSNPGKIPEDQLKKIEDIVNEQVKKELPIKREEMSPEQAKKSGALGFFEHKYGDKVSVYTIGNDKGFFSKEICTGPHVSNTKDIGRFRILKEEGVAAGIRRIKAVVE